MTNLTRRGALALGIAAPFIAPGASAQTAWPSKPVRIIVPFPPGQAADIFTRLLAERLTEIWKQQIVVDNKAGGGGIPGTEAGKAATPDGHTLMVVTSGTFGVNPSLYPDLPYKPLIDFKPIIEASLASGTEYFVVEQDSGSRPMLESVSISWRNLQQIQTTIG